MLLFDNFSVRSVYDEFFVKLEIVERDMNIYKMQLFPFLYTN